MTPVQLFRHVLLLKNFFVHQFLVRFCQAFNWGCLRLLLLLLLLLLHKNLRILSIFLQNAHHNPLSLRRSGELFAGRMVIVAKRTAWAVEATPLSLVAKKHARLALARRMGF